MIYRPWLKASEEGVPEKANERNKQRSHEGTFIILVSMFLGDVSTYFLCHSFLGHYPISMQYWQRIYHPLSFL